MFTIYEASKKWLDDKEKEFPYLTAASATIRPEDNPYDKDCCSAVLEKGFRTYAFKTEAARDAFIKWRDAL